MTKFLAQDRAERIWGPGAIVEHVYRHSERQGSGFAVSESWDVRTGDTFQFHSFDQNGHTTCHPECAQQELERCP